MREAEKDEAQLIARPIQYEVLHESEVDDLADIEDINERAEAGSLEAEMDVLVNQHNT